MDTLFHGLSEARDPLVLIAFLASIVLLAFRTKAVPDLFFGLVRDKLTRAEFARIVNRAMTLGFIFFMVLAVTGAASVVATIVLQSRVPPVAELRSELARANATKEQQDAAARAYSDALAALDAHKIDDAISSLQTSVQAIPSVTADQLLARLYRRKGDQPNATASLDAARKIAQDRGDTATVARLSRMPTAAPAPSGAESHDLIGPSAPLPKGGADLETAAPLAPGFYGCKDDGNCPGRWYRIALRRGHSLEVKRRTSADVAGYSTVTFFGTNGEALEAEDRGPGSKDLSTYEYSKLLDNVFFAPVDGTYFLRVDAKKGRCLSTKDHIRIALSG